MKTLTAFCDLAFCPVSYDFGVWLVRAMAERDARGCDSLHVVIVPKEDGLGGFARKWGEHDEAATRWRLWHIVIPMVQLAGATVTLAPSRYFAEIQLLPEVGDDWWWPKKRAHVAGPLVEAARKGAKIPRLRATDAARGYVANWCSDDDGPIVTLTTRSQTTHADRNSDAAAWTAMRDRLAEKDYRVAYLTDTHAALQESSGVWAELDADLRLALYERAAMNLIGNNGPATLLWFSDAPFIQFGIGCPEKWIAHMAEHVSLKPGDQLPWARADQRLVWRPDSFAVMREEFEKWEQQRGG